MSIGQVLLILWRRSWIAALAFGITMVVAVGILAFVPGRYDATATASIDPGAIDPVTATASAGSTAIGLMQGNMMSLVESQRVALDVVKRLNLTASPQAQAEFRASDSFGREAIDEWMAETLLKNVDARFAPGTNVLSIRYKSGTPSQAAAVANAFLAATIDTSIAMKAASGEQTAHWFEPQLEDLHKQVDAARSALTNFQTRTNLVAATAGGDTETSELMAITQNLSSAKSTLTVLQNRLTSGSTDLSNDPSDPDLQMLAGLKEKLSTGEATVAAVKNSLGANNPKMVAEAANIAAIRKQIAEVTDKMRERLKQRIDQAKRLIPSLEAQQAAAQKVLIEAEAQRSRLGDLQRDLSFRIEQLNTRERMAEQARLQSKLTFADIAVLDKAVPPIQPSFPKPFVVTAVAIGAGLALGLLLALLAEATDRRIRVPADLEFAVSAPVLGIIKVQRRPRSEAGFRRVSAV